MDKLDELLEKKKQLEERIKREKARISKTSRASNTRRKILVGAYIMDNKEQYETLRSSKAFDKYLTREKDRELFGLPSLAQPKPKIKGDLEVKPDSEKL